MKHKGKDTVDEGRRDDYTDNRLRSLGYTLDLVTKGKRCWDANILMS